MTPEEFGAEYGVSRETLLRLETLAQLLRRWSARINLVARGTLDELWARHVADSAQLLPLAPESAHHWLDLGTGAGFPGLVIAALAAEARPELRVTLVEADRRKVAFLQTAARAMHLAPEIRAARAEALPPLGADVISARALAPLPRLLALAAPHAAEEAVLLFPKGEGWDEELTRAAADWHTRVERVPSRTRPGSCILRMSELRPRNEH